MKSPKHKLLLLTVFLFVLLVSGVCGSFVPNVHAAESTTPAKALTILNDVAGFNMAAYTPSLRASEQKSFLTLPEEEADFALSSSQGKLRARCSFVSNRLHQIYVSDPSGQLSLKYQAANIVDDARGFMQRYQGYTGDSFYGGLESMLDTVSTNENVTKSAGNVQLEVSVYDSMVDFVWTYVDEDGVAAVAKNVILSYWDGLLKCYMDNWWLYQTAGKPVVSSEEAVATALKASMSYSWSVANTAEGNVTVSGAKVVSVGNTTLCYLNYREASAARGGDPFTLYPSWHVPLGFDKVYPGGVTGAYVRVWADTGEVSEISPMIYGDASFSEQPSSKVKVQEQTTVAAVVPPIALVVAVGMVGFYLGNSKKRFCWALKKRSLRLCSTLLCVAISFSLVFAAVPQAKAVYGTVASVIYGSTVGQFQGYSGGFTINEITAASQVCDMLEYLFRNNGYGDTTINAFDEGTTKQNILNNAYNMDRDYEDVAVFYHGHMNGANNYWCNGGNVTYQEIAAETDGSTVFAWSWVCESANSASSGLPVAWTKDYGMSPDGYSNPYGNHCYIGFSGASPTLSAGSFENWTGLAMDFITQFYYYALEYDASIRDALNSASNAVFSESYLDCPLTQFWTWWPSDFGGEMGPGWKLGQMRVYGYGNLKLWQPAITVNAHDNNNNYVYPSVYVDSEYAGSAFNPIHLSKGYHTIAVDSSYSGRYFQHFNGNPWGLNPVQVFVTQDTALTAVYTQPDYSLSISAGEGGSVTPYGTQWYYQGQNAPVYAFPCTYYVFDHWILDGNDAGSNPSITVTMYASHTLQAVFTYSTASSLLADC